MGTRYEDQPVEQWAGPESLDPTPVWKQYLLVAAFVVLALVLVAFVAYTALAVELATPPASVIGGRVVLAASDVPVGGPSKLYGPPLVDEAHSFYLFQYKKDEFLAVAASAFPSMPPGADLGVSVSDTAGGPPPNVDHYLVSVEGSKVVVNTSRLLKGVEVVPAPTATR